jgi:hypothetical protein
MHFGQALGIRYRLELPRQSLKAFLLITFRKLRKLPEKPAFVFIHLRTARCVTPFYA